MAVRPSERGVALALVLVVGVLLSVTTMVLLQVVGFRFQGVESQRRRDAGFYAAEAAIQMTFPKLNRQLPPYQDQSIAGWPVGTDKGETVTIDDRQDTDPANDITVTVTVTRRAATGDPKDFRVGAEATLP